MKALLLPYMIVRPDGRRTPLTTDADEFRRSAAGGGTPQEVGGIPFSCLVLEAAGAAAGRVSHIQEGPTDSPRQPAVRLNPVLVQGGECSWRTLHRIAVAAAARYERREEELDVFAVWDSTGGGTVGRLAELLGADPVELEAFEQ